MSEPRFTFHPLTELDLPLLHEWLFVHGPGASMALLQESGRVKNASIELDGDLHDLALQDR